MKRYLDGELKWLLGQSLLVATITSLVAPSSAAADGVSTCELAGLGSESSPYSIGSTSDFLQLDVCFADTGTTVFKLVDDISFSGNEYLDASQPVGPTLEPNGQAALIIDGNGKQIQNFSVADSAGSGLFGIVLDSLEGDHPTDVTVKDLTIFADAVASTVTTPTAGTGLFFDNVQGSLSIQNVNVFARHFSCTSACGLISGGLTGEAIVEDSTFVVDNLSTTGQSSGILFGQVQGDLTVDGSVVDGSYRLFSQTSGNRLVIGGITGNLFGPLIGDGVGESEATVSNTFVKVRLLGSEGDALPDVGDSDIYVGGMAGVFVSFPEGAEPVEDGVSVIESFFDVSFSQARYFGGLMGSNGGSEFDLDVENSRFNLKANGPNPVDNGDPEFGGLIGEANGVFNISVNQTIIQAEFSDDEAGDPARSGFFQQIVSTSTDRTLTVTNSVLDQDAWQDGGLAQPSGVTGMTYLETTEIENNEKDGGEALPFSVGSKSQGVIGTDSWEFLRGFGPFPAITPNAFNAGWDEDENKTAVTLPSNSLELTLNEPIADFVPSDPYNSRADITRYLISPDLPKGLVMDPITGTISGTPRELKSTTTYTLNLQTAAGFTIAEEGEPAATFTIEVKMPPDPEPETIRDTVIIEREVPGAYEGPLLTDVSKKQVIRCQEAEVSLKGQDLDQLEQLFLGATSVDFDVSNDTLTFTPSCLEKGEYDLELESEGGTLVYRQLIELTETQEEESSESQPTEEKMVNAGSFKGYVAVYARGYEGSRLSAKIGNDWVIVDPIVNNQGANLFRVTDFTGAGVEIAVRIYIDRVLVETINLTTL